MDKITVMAKAVGSLLLWECRDRDHLRELLATWQYRALLDDGAAAQVVDLVAEFPHWVRADTGGVGISVLASEPGE